VFLVLIASAAPLRADHPPDWLVSRAKVEKSLAGIRVGKTTIAAASRLYGPFSARSFPSNPHGTEYTWVRPASTIVAMTDHPPDMPQGEQVIYKVEVHQSYGQRSRVATGAGVSIGSKLPDLLRAYGPRYLTHWRDLSDVAATITFIFADGSELAFGFADEGQVIAISLEGSTE
jgi:hypothetical protein